LISLGYVIIVFVFPLDLAVVISLIYGFLVLSTVSYLIAKSRKINPWFSILEHLAITFLVVFVSKLAGELIIEKFK